MPTIQCHRHVVVLLEASGRVEVTQSAPISQNMYWNRLQQALSSAHLTLPGCRVPQFHQAQLSRPPVVSGCQDFLKYWLRFQKISTSIGSTFKLFPQVFVPLSKDFHKYWLHFQKISTSIGWTFKRFPQVLAALSKAKYKILFVNFGTSTKKNLIIIRFMLIWRWFEDEPGRALDFVPCSRMEWNLGCSQNPWKSDQRLFISNELTLFLFALPYHAPCPGAEDHCKLCRQAPPFDQFISFFAKIFVVVTDERKITLNRYYVIHFIGGHKKRKKVDFLSGCLSLIICQTWNGFSRWPLPSFHRPPTWTKSWVLNTVRWRPGSLAVS